MRPSAVGLIAVLVVIVATLAAYVVLAVNGVDTDTFTGQMMPMVLPTLTALLVYIKVDKVEQNTNGHMTKLIDTVAHSTPVVDQQQMSVQYSAEAKVSDADEHNH